MRVEPVDGNRVDTKLVKITEAALKSETGM
jgi:hypothetical protein